MMFLSFAYDPAFGGWSESVDGKDLLAIFLVINFFVVSVILGYLFRSIRRSEANHCRETSRLLDELAGEENEGFAKPASAGKREDPPTNSWERDADWWKK